MLESQRIERLNMHSKAIVDPVEQIIKRNLNTHDRPAQNVSVTDPVLGKRVDELRLELVGVKEQLLALKKLPAQSDAHKTQIENLTQAVIFMQEAVTKMDKKEGPAKIREVVDLALVEIN